MGILTEHQWSITISDQKYYFNIDNHGTLSILVKGFGSSDWKPAYAAAKQFGWHPSFPLDCVCKELLAIKDGTRLESVLKSLQTIVNDNGGV